MKVVNDEIAKLDLWIASTQRIVADNLREYTITKKARFQQCAMRFSLMLCDAQKAVGILRVSAALAAIKP